MQKKMRFFLIILLSAQLVLSDSDDDPLNNEIPVDELLTKARNESSKNESDFDGFEDIKPGKHITLDEAYKNSVQSYLDEDWDGCIEGFTEAIQRYKLYKKAVVTCRRNCREKAAGSQPIFRENIEDLHFYEKKVRETLCLLNCNQDYRDVAGSQALKRISKDIEMKYVERTPYEYLHICFYQKNRFQDAANAIFTFLVLHPKHEMSLKNLRYYVSLPEVTESQVTNLEIEPFFGKYIDGVNAYDEENYVKAADRLESSILSYIKAEEDCRLYCEGPFDQGWHPEFTSSVANHFAYCLKCKRSCSQLLNNVNGDYHKDLLPGHYDYLQFAYYKLGNLKKACAAVASYLLFYPADETMLENKEYYANLPQVDEDSFTPREEAVMYVKRQEYELRLLSYISQEFVAIGARLDAAKKRADQEELDEEDQSTNHPPPGHSPSFQLRLFNNETATWEDVNKLLENSSQSKESARSAKEIRVVADEHKLGGKLRYLAEGFLNDSECQSLIHLAQTSALDGDGYEGNASPHSAYERFEGLNLGRAALMVYFGLMNPETLELFLRSTETARDHVERYFNLDRHLYFTYTHLACRSPLPDAPKDRQDLSHAIHADNCIATENGSCLAEYPAYTFRDYSAIVYLNDDFEGGEFVFAGDSKARIIQSTIEPRCGRMVAFSASGENLHGVRGVLSGKRCALALWFTFEKSQLEVERILAWAVTKRVRANGFVKPADGEIINSAQYENILSNKFEVDEKLRHLLDVLESS